MSARRSGLRIRSAKPDDCPSIASVLYQSFVEHQSAYTEQAFAATTPTSDQIQSRLNEGPLWVAVQNGIMVGTVSAVPKGEALYIRSMAVLPTARGQNVGGSLLQQIERYARRQGCRSLFLSTTPFLTRAIRLYERYGFQRSGDSPPDLFGTPLIMMMRRLSQP